MDERDDIMNEDDERNASRKKKIVATIIAIIIIIILLLLRACGGNGGTISAIVTEEETQTEQANVDDEEELSLNEEDATVADDATDDADDDDTSTSTTSTEVTGENDTIVVVTTDEGTTIYITPSSSTSSDSSSSSSSSSSDDDTTDDDDDDDDDTTDDDDDDDDDTDDVTYYTVTFIDNDMDNTTSVASQTIAEGEFAVAPADPTREGYIFDGWYLCIKDEAAFDFAATPITGNTTLIAKWVKDTAQAPDTTPDQDEDEKYQGQKDLRDLLKKLKEYIESCTFSDLIKDALYELAQQIEDVIEADIDMDKLDTIKAYIEESIETLNLIVARIQAAHDFVDCAIARMVAAIGNCGMGAEPKAKLLVFANSLGDVLKDNVDTLMYNAVCGKGETSVNTMKTVSTSGTASFSTLSTSSSAAITTLAVTNAAATDDASYTTILELDDVTDALSSITDTVETLTEVYDSVSSAWDTIEETASSFVDTLDDLLGDYIDVDALADELLAAIEDLDMAEVWEALNEMNDFLETIGIDLGLDEIGELITGLASGDLDTIYSLLLQVGEVIDETQEALETMQEIIDILENLSGEMYKLEASLNDLNTSIDESIDSGILSGDVGDFLMEMLDALNEENDKLIILIAEGLDEYVEIDLTELRAMVTTAQELVDFAEEIYDIVLEVFEWYYDIAAEYGDLVELYFDEENLVVYIIIPDFTTLLTDSLEDILGELDLDLSDSELTSSLLSTFGLDSDVLSIMDTLGIDIMNASTLVRLIDALGMEEYVDFTIGDLVGDLLAVDEDSEYYALFSLLPDEIMEKSLYEFLKDPTLSYSIAIGLDLGSLPEFAAIFDVALPDEIAEIQFVVSFEAWEFFQEPDATTTSAQALELFLTYLESDKGIVATWNLITGLSNLGITGISDLFFGTSSSADWYESESLLEMFGLEDSGITLSLTEEEIDALTTAAETLTEKFSYTTVSPEDLYLLSVHLGVSIDEIYDVVNGYATDLYVTVTTGEVTYTTNLTSAQTAATLKTYYYVAFEVDGMVTSYQVVLLTNSVLEPEDPANDDFLYWAREGAVYDFGYALTTSDSAGFTLTAVFAGDVSDDEYLAALAGTYSTRYTYLTIRTVTADQLKTIWVYYDCALSDLQDEIDAHAYVAYDATYLDDTIYYTTSTGASAAFGYAAFEDLYNLAVAGTSTVTWAVEGAETVTELVKNGEIALEAMGDKDGLDWAGWYSDVDKELYTGTYTVSGDVTLTATWLASSYDVTYVYGNGTESETDNVTAGGTVAEPAALTRDGYIFMGWTCSPDYTFDTVLTQDITITATWQSEEEYEAAYLAMLADIYNERYTYTYLLTDYTSTISVDNLKTIWVYYGCELTDLEDKIDEHSYTATIGTYTPSSGYYYLSSTHYGYEAFKDLLSIATYANTHYTITFMNDGVQYDKYDDAVIGADVSITDPTKATDTAYEYTFSHWALAADGADAVDFTTFTDDVIVYAVYTKTEVSSSYTVTFSYIDGKTSEVTVVDGKTVAAPANTTATSDYEYYWDFDFTTAIIEDVTITEKATFTEEMKTALATAVTNVEKYIYTTTWSGFSSSTTHVNTDEEEIYLISLYLKYDVVDGATVVAGVTTASAGSNLYYKIYTECKDSTLSTPDCSDYADLLAEAKASAYADSYTWSELYG